MTIAPILPGNREVLGERPEVLEAVDAATPPADAEIWTAADGATTARVNGVTMHHAEEPRREARRWALAGLERAREIGADRIVVVGFALGHHLEALADVFDGEILVFEPDADLLRLALSARELAPLLLRIRLDVRLHESEVAGACVLSYAPMRLLAGEGYARAVRRCDLAAARGAPPLRVLVVTPMYGGSHPIALQAHAALRRLGHDAELLDLAAFLPAFRDLERFGGRRSRRRVTESLFCDTLGDGVAARVEEGSFDLVLALAQAPLSERALAAIRKAGALTAFWFVEDHRVFPYGPAIASHYDHVFTIQQGECLAEFRRAGAKEVEYLPCAAAPDVHRPMLLSDGEQRQLRSDVSFVGAGYRNRRNSFPRFLDLDFRIWGSDWDGATELAPVVQRGGARVSTADSVRIWNATRVNLNLHSSTYCDGVDPRGDFVNPRTFELAATEAFQVVDRRALLGECFEEGREVVAVRDVAEMREAAQFFLQRPEERREIAAAGRKRVLRDHTYDRRMEQLIASVVSIHPERFAGRSHRFTVGDAREMAGDLLRGYLGEFSESTTFTLESMVSRIPEESGALTEPEALFLFLSQFDDLYLSEYRR